ncbi:hypothetical protein BASA83_011994 [Batrachochytrium salamandrivorans]|nr:hypothetical protein BASA83_011994 [Batrachochytrium salamandrivorans]
MSGLDSRLLPPNSREWMVVNNGSSTLTISTAAVSDGRTDLVFAAARAMSGNSSRSAAVTPLYNSDGIVQYDPTSILRVMQCHYGSLAADTTGHSLDFLNGEANLDQRWLDGTVEHESMGTRHDDRAAGQHGLADFLQVAYQAVSIHIVAQYHQDRLVEVG